MKKLFLALSILVLTLLRAAASSDARAYELLGEGFGHWDHTCLTHADIPALSDALQAWAEVSAIDDCGISPTPDIRFEDEPKESGLSGSGYPVLKSGNVIDHWVIKVNPRLSASAVRYTFLHEIGHALGLAHSGEAGSVMRYPDSSQWPTELSPDDIAGIQAIHGPPVVMDHFTTSDWRWQDSCFTHDSTIEVIAALVFWSNAANISDCGISAAPEISFEVAPEGYFTGNVLGEAASSASGPVNGPFMFVHCTIRIRPGYEHDKRVIDHEFGHCLGMNHSADPNALMAAVLSPNNTGALTADDIAGIQSIYGPPISTPPAPKGRKLFLASIAHD